mmetsp:Transcript_27501/g.51321  ORF Transcript_27501/g.51321 Transcript_27501/m.51321 type:complete len:205 (-) Transcript_27501:159-773(-)
MQLREPEAVRVFDDEGVGVRKVEAILYHHRRHHHVSKAHREPEDLLFKVSLPTPGFHHAYAPLPRSLPRDWLEIAQDLRRYPAEHGCAWGDVRAPGYNVEELAAALEHLPHDRVAYTLLRKLPHPRACDEASGGGMKDATQAPDAELRHLQRAWDGGCREREDVGARCDQPLQVLLLRHSKPLLLVDNHQPKPGKLEGAPSRRR